MDQARFEQAVQHMVHGEGMRRLTPSEVGNRLGMKVQDAERMLDRMVTEGTLELDSDDEGNLFYFVPGVGQGGVFTVASELGPAPTVDEGDREGASFASPPSNPYVPGGSGAAPGPWTPPAQRGWSGPGQTGPAQPGPAQPGPAQTGPGAGAWTPPAAGASNPWARGPQGPQPPRGPSGPPPGGWQQPGPPPGYGSPYAPPPQAQPPYNPYAAPPGPPPNAAPWGQQGPYGPGPAPGHGQQWGPQAPHGHAPHGYPGYAAPPHAHQALVTARPGEIRSPATAAILSAFFPGAGQLYNGQIGKGLTFFFLTVLLVSAFQPFMLVPYVWSIMDAYNTSRRINAYGLLPP